MHLTALSGLAHRAEYSGLLNIRMTVCNFSEITVLTRYQSLDSPIVSIYRAGRGVEICIQVYAGQAYWKQYNTVSLSK